VAPTQEVSVPNICAKFESDSFIGPAILVCIGLYKHASWEDVVWHLLDGG